MKLQTPNKWLNEKPYKQQNVQANGQTIGNQKNSQAFSSSKVEMTMTYDVVFGKQMQMCISNHLL